MDHYPRINRDSEDSYSHPPRSRASSTVSTTAGFRNLNLVDSYHSRPVSSRGPQASYTSGPHCSAPSIPNHASYPALPSRAALDAEWNERQFQSQDIPSLKVEPVQESFPSTSSLPPPSVTSTMSTVAVAFDPRLEMGIPRSTYTWPGLESGHDLLGHDLSSVGHGSDASMTPPSASRSLTSSPPRFTFTPEQRELKRQRDQARRDSKTTVRARRAMSTYSSASQSPTLSMHEFSSASPVPVYSTAPSQISLLAEPATTMAGSYMPSYSTSPLPDHGSPMFASHFSSLPPADYLGLNYSPGYPPPPPSAHGLPSHYSRPSPPMPEPAMMYPVQPPQVLSSGSATGQESGHVRVVQSRPKPQCWEHGCNGRQFSTFSNLLRHQREKSGQAAKATCPNCGAEFTRTTARNGHLLHDKCKQRRNN
ncbi:uncharacterized protein F4812DRAFT_456438 [Daldinia caldariorum]|uniref:uncharacterized protein n=1 Tax=Daldinia caldariorum TaxID=326644 RepID=UPI002008B8A0|nr:uncharacterized protein F4812DRAFT_456438 [Daldinia caldariorum]KAI1470429.1 hypothetical protein F4812DRAFT_456438 [Daldinia caldariorum]